MASGLTDEEVIRTTDCPWCWVKAGTPCSRQNNVSTPKKDRDIPHKTRRIYAETML